MNQGGRWVFVLSNRYIRFMCGEKYASTGSYLPHKMPEVVARCVASYRWLAAYSDQGIVRAALIYVVLSHYIYRSRTPCQLKG